MSRHKSGYIYSADIESEVPHVQLTNGSDRRLVTGDMFIHNLRRRICRPAYADVLVKPEDYMKSTPIVDKDKRLSRSGSVGSSAAST
jgi:hypothetical protein